MIVFNESIRTCNIKRQLENRSERNVTLSSFNPCFCLKYCTLFPPDSDRKKTHRGKVTAYIMYAYWTRKGIMERAKRAGGRLDPLTAGKLRTEKWVLCRRVWWRNCPKCYSSSKCNYWFLCLCYIPMNFVKMLSISMNTLWFYRAWWLVYLGKILVHQYRINMGFFCRPIPTRLKFDPNLMCVRTIQGVP